MGKKIALGFGNNIDYEIIWDSKTFERLIMEYEIRHEELSMDIPIRTKRDLVVSILGFLKSETGGERFVSSSKVIEDFAKDFEYKITLGGTSVRAALAMETLGYNSALHLVTINDDVRRLLPRGSSYVCSAKGESSHPHLIIQFCQGTRIKASDIDICTKSANRVIYHNDYDNIIMELNEDFGDLVNDAKVFLISGFNAMQDSNLLAKRMETVKKIMESLPEDAIVFYEDACFYDPKLSHRVRRSLLDYIDIYSMNEDELQGYLGRKVDLLDPLSMKEAFVDIHELIPAPTILIHTKYWVAAYGKNPSLYSRGIEGGITMAGTRFRFGDDFTAKDYENTKELPRQEKGVNFAMGIEKLLTDRICCLASVQADETNATTIGLGDSFVGGFLPNLV